LRVTTSWPVPLKLASPAHVFAFASIDEAHHLPLRVTHEDATRPRLASDEEYILDLGNILRRRATGALCS
jgi:hypothetical protein